jgi:hypothetical protein
VVERSASSLFVNGPADCQRGPELF